MAPEGNGRFLGPLLCVCSDILGQVLFLSTVSSFFSFVMPVKTHTSAKTIGCWDLECGVGGAKGTSIYGLYGAWPKKW